MEMEGTPRFCLVQDLPTTPWGDCQVKEASELPEAEEGQLVEAPAEAWMRMRGCRRCYVDVLFLFFLIALDKLLKSTS